MSDVGRRGFFERMLGGLFAMCGFTVTYQAAPLDGHEYVAMNGGPWEPVHYRGGRYLDASCPRCDRTAVSNREALIEKGWT